MTKAYQVAVVGPLGAQKAVQRKAIVWQCPSKSIYAFLAYAALYALAAAVYFRPWIVLAGSGLTAPIAYAVTKISGSKCVVYLHGLDIALENRLYQGLWRPFFPLFDKVIVNSKFTRYLAEKTGVKPYKIVTLHPGVNLPDMKLSQQKRKIFRNRFDLRNDPLILYVGRLTSRKGLTVFVKEIFPHIIKLLPTAKLMVIGDDASHALFHKDNEGQILRKTVQKSGLNDSVIFLGYVTDDELDAAYFAADSLIFPVQQHCHDIEGFGMVAIEAAAHGLPTVAFAAGGVPDAVKDGISGRLIPPGDNEAFANAVLEILSHSEKDRWRNSCRKFAENFSWAVFGDRLRRICSEIIAK